MISEKRRCMAVQQRSPLKVLEIVPNSNNSNNSNQSKRETKWMKTGKESRLTVTCPPAQYLCRVVVHIPSDMYVMTSSSLRTGRGL